MIYGCEVKKNVFSETDNAIFPRKLCEPTSVTVKLLENVVIPFQKKRATFRPRIYQFDYSFLTLQQHIAKGISSVLKPPKSTNF